jgi:hypothetical protein
LNFLRYDTILHRHFMVGPASSRVGRPNRELENSRLGRPAREWAGQLASWPNSRLGRNIYELWLLHKMPLNPWIKPWTNLRSNIYRPHQLAPGLMLTNKDVHKEVIRLFYAKNRFDFTRCGPRDLTLFLNQIGCNNANYIAHIPSSSQPRRKNSHSLH